MSRAVHHTGMMFQSSGAVGLSDFLFTGLVTKAKDLVRIDGGGRLLGDVFRICAIV